MRSWLCTQERWNPEVANIFGAAARYRRATVGSSHDHAHPDSSALHTGKIYSFRCTSADFFFSCCDGVAAPRQRPGRHDQVPANNNERRRGHRPRHHAQQLLAQRRGQRPGASIKFLRRTTSAAADNCLGSTINEHSPVMHDVRRRGHRPGQNDQVPTRR